MSSEVQSPPEQSTVSLLTEIMGDFQRLIGQQLLLTRREIEEELRQRGLAAIVMAIGGSLLLVDLFVVSLTLAHLLHWLTSPTGTDPAAIPLWGCYAVFAALLAIGGGVATQVGWARFRSVKSFRNPISEILEEPVRWTNLPK